MTQGLFPAALFQQATRICALATSLNARGLVVETCTGGLLSALLTQVPGASRYFLGGLCVYDNQLKSSLLGADQALMIAHGAVSEQACQDLAQTALKTCAQADFSLAITGIAGPAGGSAHKRTGLAYISFCARPEQGALQINQQHNLCDHDRWRYRIEAVTAACTLLENSLQAMLAQKQAQLP